MKARRIRLGDVEVFNGYQIESGDGAEPARDGRGRLVRREQFLLEPLVYVLIEIVAAPPRGVGANEVARLLDLRDELRAAARTDAPEVIVSEETWGLFRDQIDGLTFGRVSDLTSAAIAAVREAEQVEIEPAPARHQAA